MGELLSEPIDQEVGSVKRSPPGPLLFILLANNISGTLNLGKIVCYADDSYLIFKEETLGMKYAKWPVKKQQM